MDHERLVYDPRAAGTVSRRNAVPLPPLDGLAVGVIDNSKPGFNVIAEAARAELRERSGTLDGPYRTKWTAAVAADDAVYDEMAQKCGVVLTGSGD